MHIHPCSVGIEEYKHNRVQCKYYISVCWVYSQIVIITFFQFTWLVLSNCRRRAKPTTISRRLLGQRRLSLMSIESSHHLCDVMNSCIFFLFFSPTCLRSLFLSFNLPLFFFFLFFFLFFFSCRPMLLAFVLFFHNVCAMVPVHE